MRAHQRPGRAPCTVDGCERPNYCHLMCIAHYERTRRTGDPGGPELRRVPKGSGHINEYGYRVLKIEGHPLARAQGKVLEHRAVLYDRLGPGPHPCEWCGKSLDWSGRPSERINGDHLDHDKLNNLSENLVPACLDCNTKRRQVVAA